jgi:hypothetical protein
MRPKERRKSGQSDPFRAGLDQIVDLGRPLPKLRRAIDIRLRVALTDNNRGASGRSESSSALAGISTPAIAA